MPLFATVEPGAPACTTSCRKPSVCNPVSFTSSRTTAARGLDRSGRRICRGQNPRSILDFSCPFLSCSIVTVPTAQQLLFPDPQPLVERLGRDFFRQLPECPGVYLIRDACDVILYVGKAKNLRKRLGSYRVANPDRMPRRHLRLLRNVARIELQECPDESSASARESEILRTVRPKFNRAGTWPAPPRFFAWRCLEQQLHLTVV